MKLPTLTVLRDRLLAALLLVGSAAISPLAGQTATSSSTATGSLDEAEPVMLSPFTVNAETDKGYRATNSISGSRLNTAIKDIPMPIEVITEKLLRDTGSTDLRQTLRYSAGILLQTQNDMGNSGANAYQGPGGVNNPEGVTANPNQTSIKIRGYVTDTVLRDGYRRQTATDSVNVSRVEVVRGPAALLYGIGNFGGIVNYLPKMPENKFRGEVTATYGSWDFTRGTIDVTGPISEKWDFKYRLTGAIQDTRDYTQYYTERHSFVSPVISFKPTPTTEVVLDFERGEQDQNGTGFKQIRAVAGDENGSVGINNDQNEHGGFVVFKGQNPREFRWSGPDTYLNTEADNARIQVTQQIVENLTLLAGYNQSHVDFESLDVQGNFRRNSGPVSMRGTVILSPIDQVRGDSSNNIILGPSPNTTFEYVWNDTDTYTTGKQTRIELNYALKLFEKRSKWLQIHNSFLAGYTEERRDTDVFVLSNPQNVFNYKNPEDLTAIRLGQGVKIDGTVGDVALTKNRDTLTTAWNKGKYFVYQGKFLDDRVTVVSGIRRDENNVNVYNNAYTTNTITNSKSAVQADQTTQNGINIEIIPALSVYALKAGGIMPNFDGKVDVSGKPIRAVTARSEEFGAKIDLLNGKITGTVSSFKIKRSGTPVTYWWAPTNFHVTYDKTKPIVYQVNDMNPTARPDFTPSNAGIANAAKWQAGVAAGSIRQQTNASGATNWYVDASTTSGAAFLDGIFDYTKENGGWPGWLYNYDNVTNNNWESISTAGGYPQAYVTTEDSAKGWDAQIMFTPTDNLQLILTYSHVKRVIDTAGRWISYPHTEDRWAVWYFPNSDWGLAGRDLNTVYSDPNDTSTWTGEGFGTGEKQDDTPEHQVSVWGNYSFRSGFLKGLTIGAGGYWESEREFMSGITHGSGQFITDKEGKRLILSTDVRYNVDFMARYEFKLGQHDAYAQLNVYNLLDDQKRYGFIYSTPRSMHLELGYRF